MRVFLALSILPSWPHPSTDNVSLVSSQHQESAGYGDPDVFYSDYYNRVICSGGTGATAAKGLHRFIERGLRRQSFERVLELGSGQGEHFPFVEHDFVEYTMLDVREVELLPEVKSDTRVKQVVGDASALPFEDEAFDRVLHVCLLHHVGNPEQVMTEVRRVLKPGGLATIFVSADPGMLNRIVRNLTTSKVAKRYGFHGYHLMIAREHRNHVAGLLEMLKWHFRQDVVKRAWYPFGIPSWNFNGGVVFRVVKSRE